MRNLILSLLLILCTVAGFTQEDQNKYIPHDYSKLPPSPEVSSLMKYIDFPVSYFTGQPDINIPIYTIQEGGLSIPISISYHGGGIKVNEHQGLIGMGWTLIAGGSVSRTVNGLPDEMNGGRFNSLHGIFNLNSDEKNLRNVIMNRIGEYDPEIWKNKSQIIEASRYCSTYDEGKADMANDIFQFNFMGLSGTFIQSPGNGQITMSTGSPVTLAKDFISMLTNYPECYKFTDKDGTRYELACPERTLHEYSYEGGNGSVSDSLRYISSWHLTAVKNIHGDAAKFEYSEAMKKTLGNGPYNYFALSQDYISHPHESVATGNYTIYYPKVLKCIKGKTTIVKFYYDEAEETLLKITVHKNDATETQIKQINFIHEQRKLGAYYKNFLIKIEEVCGNKTQTLYKFDYEGGILLGSEYIYAQDHWGYYNGKLNSTLLWEVGKEISTKAKIANRDPNFVSTEIGILKSVTYPTGGITEFEWELNDYSFIKNSIISSTTSIDTIKTNYNLSGNLNCINLKTGIINVTEYSSDYRTSIYIDMSKYIKSIMDGGTFNWDKEYNHSHYDKKEIDNYDYTAYPNHPQVQIIKKNANGSETIKERYFIDKETCDRISYLGTGVYTISLDIGQYYIKLANPRNFEGVAESQINGYFGYGADSHCMETGYVPITIVCQGKVDTGNTKKWGGLRIKSITSHSGFDKICKNYDYTLEYNGKKYSSGVIYEEPRYEYDKYKAGVLHTGDNQFQSGFVRMHCTTSGGLYSTPTGGSHVEYMSVNESYSGNNFGKMRIKYNYTSQFEFPDKMNMILESCAPTGSRMYTSMGHHRGILTEKEFFNKDDFPYKTINYEYNIKEGSSPIFTNQLTQINDCYRSCWEGMKSDYTVARFQLFPYNKRLIYEATTEYEQGDYYHQYTDSIRYTYFADVFSAKPENSFVRSKSYTNSLGQEVTTYYTYLRPEEYGPYVDLKETEVTVVDGKITAASRTAYNMYFKHPEYTYSCKTGIPVLPAYALGSGLGASKALLDAIDIPEYRYTYDGCGNLIEIQYNGVVLASYLWGYKGTYPILEAKNVSIGDLTTRLAEVGINNTENLSEISDDNSVKNILEQIRTKLPDKEITTMTYHWLIGVSTATDSRGITTHFTFDDFGRLSDVKDYNGYFIRKYDYHYAEPINQ